MNNSYTQCKLLHKESGRVDIVWIPSGLAILKKQLKVKSEDGWDEGWSVAKVYSSAPRKEIVDKSRDHRRMSTFGE